MNKLIKKTVALLLVIAITSICTLGLSGCGKEVVRNFFAADTICSITIYEGNVAALDGAVELCNNLADKLNCKSETSEITELNKNGFAKNPDQDVLEVINKGLYYSKLRDGVFDITVKPLTDLWDFKNQKVPDKTSLKVALGKVNYENVSPKFDEIVLRNGAQIDLGAIAKGYIAQRVEEYLRENGVTSAIINLGGNVTLIGSKKGRDFSVGIRKPFEEEIIATIVGENFSAVTSGIYQRYFEADGQIYHHLLSTKSGTPQNNGVNSVTIITKNPTDADALSTLCFLLGINDGTSIIESLNDTEAVWVDSENKIHLTSGLEIDENMNIYIK